jgi:HAD superfamily hydrolase (TIGR01662 family)
MTKEIHFTIGLPGSGKTEFVKKFIASGCINLNRDDIGGTIESLHKLADQTLLQHDKIILDNTYLTAESRKPLLELAKKHGAELYGYYMRTDFDDCQFNVCMRAELGGRIVPAAALYAMRKQLEEPKMSEGFYAGSYPFKRTLPADYVNKAVILDYDGTVRTCPPSMKYPTEVSHIALIPGIQHKIQKYVDKGYLILGASNQSGVGKGVVSKEKMDELFLHTNKLLGHDIDVLYCPDSSFPIKSYDRKPLPGMGVKHIVKYKLDPKSCIMVGDMTTDQTFARRCGFKFIHADKF